LQTISNEISEALLPLIRLAQRWWRVVHYLENDLHGWELLVRGLTIGQFDGCDAKGPDVSALVMTSLLHDLRGHPTR